MKVGREQGAIIQKYLEALDTVAPQHGPRRDPERIARQLVKIDKQLLTASKLAAVSLLQDRINLLKARDQIASANALEDLEADFIEVVKPYSDRRGISYSAWREIGVSKEALIKAGIRPTRLTGSALTYESTATNGNGTATHHVFEEEAEASADLTKAFETG
jgi:hypothetical protein